MKKQGIGFLNDTHHLGGAMYRCRHCHRAIYSGYTKTLSKLEHANVSIPVAILIWLMIYPMMLKVDFQSVKNVEEATKRHYCNLRHQLADKAVYDVRYRMVIFLCDFQKPDSADLANEYLAGAVLLGAAPCTAMFLYGVILPKAMQPIRWCRWR